MRLRPSQPVFESPIYAARKTADERLVHVSIHDPSGNASDAQIREVGDEHPQASGIKERAGVRKHNDVPPRGTHGGVLDPTLSLPLSEVEQSHARARVFPHDVARRVGRSVRRDYQLDPIRWVVRRQDVLDAPANGLLLVVRRHDD